MRKYRPEVRLSTWLYKIITNLCLDFLKSTHRKQQLKQIDVESNSYLVDKASEESHLDDREMLKVIVELAKQLTSKQRTAFILRDLESLPVEEVCEISGMNTVQVKSNLYHARMNIREGLTRYYRETTKL